MSERPRCRAHRGSCALPAVAALLDHRDRLQLACGMHAIAHRDYWDGQEDGVPVAAVPLEWLRELVRDERELRARLGREITQRAARQEASRAREAAMELRLSGQARLEIEP